LGWQKTLWDEAAKEVERSKALSAHDAHKKSKKELFEELRAELE
jgi:hypothetical protein